MLFRKTLNRRICLAKENPLILVSGPAGSGKTSLVCQAIKLEKLQVAWYSLDEEDNEPDLFFRYLLTTLARMDEQLNSDLSPLLEQIREISYENVIPHLIAPLSAVSQNIHLVLDDFHHIDNLKIHTALALLIKYIPHRLRIVIISRYRLPDQIDAVILKKERLELTASDLKFTETETADLYKKVIPLPFSPHEIETINRHVEGWAAGLQLIGLSVRAKGPMPDLSYILSQAHEQINSYLIHDILRTQPENIRKFVFATALLDRFNPELCSEVTGLPNATKILVRLMRMNLFLIPLDSERTWYRYHHIFSEAVRRQTALIDPLSIPKTLRTAARWLAQNNHLEEALRTAFRSNDIEFIADLMEDYIMGYVDTFNITAGLRWLSKLPIEIMNQRPLLKLQQSCFHSIMMELTEVKEILSALENNGKPDFSRYSGEKHSVCRDYFAYLKCTEHILCAGETASITELQTLRKKIFPKNPLLVGAIETHIVFSLISKGDLASAESLAAGPSQVPLHKPNHFVRKKIYHAKIKAFIAQHRGRLQQAETIIIQTLKFVDKQRYGNSPLAFILHRHLGSIYYHQNRLEEAHECAANAEKYYESEFFGLMDQIMAGNELRLQLHRAAGEYDQALKCIRHIQAYSIKLGIPRIAAGADASVALLSIDQNNLAMAEVWLKRRNLSPDEPFSLLFATECLTQARLFYALRQYAKATQVLEKLRRRCLKRSLRELILKIDILQAATLHAVYQDTKALSLLSKAMAFAEAEGYIRPFINDSKLIAPILKQMANHRPTALSTAFLIKIFTACNTSFVKPPKQQYSHACQHDDLTNREVEILKWMAQGYQNKEIAKKGCIAVSTVKSYVSNILVKLNVKTRTQAVLKAKEMNILNAA